MRIIDNIRFGAFWTLNKNRIISNRELPPSEQKSTLASFNTVNMGDYIDRDFLKGRTLGGNVSHAGVSVTLDSALDSSAWYAGVKIIAEDMGSMPLVLYRRSKDRQSTEKASDDYRFSILRSLPNPDTSAGEFVEAITSHAAMCGTGYAFKERSINNSQLVYLWPWMPYEVRQAKDSKGRVIYLHKENDNRWKTYSSDDVFSLRGLTFDGTSGDPILQRARHALGLTLAAQEYAGRYFSQDASPGIVLKFPNKLGQGPDAVQNIKAAWKKWHQGLSNSHEPAVLQEGAEIERMDSKPAESQLIEQRTFQILETCRYLRLSPYKLAELTHATFSNIEEMSIEHNTHCLGPWRRRWRESVHRCLFSRGEQLEDSLYAEHNVEALQRGDFEGQSTAFAKLLEKGVYSINDVRRWLGLNPVEGGDAHHIQLNMQSVADTAAAITQVGGKTIAEIQPTS